MTDRNVWSNLFRLLYIGIYILNGETQALAVMHLIHKVHYMTYICSNCYDFITAAILFRTMHATPLHIYIESVVHNLNLMVPCSTQSTTRRYIAAIIIGNAMIY